MIYNFIMILINVHFLFFFIFEKINLLIQISSTVDRNTKSKVLKTLEDKATSRLIEKMIDSRPTHLIIKKCL